MASWTSAKRKLILLYRELGMHDEAGTAEAELRTRLALADPDFWALRGLDEIPESFDAVVLPQS